MSSEGTGDAHGSRQLVVIFGPPAVGKMAVGRELSRLTGLPLLHNHMTIEPLLGIFEFGSPEFGRLVRSFRQQIYEEVVQSDLPGLIVTYMWCLGHDSDRETMEEIMSLFESHGFEIRFVELEAALEERLRRNRTELRLQEKASKRDVEASEERLLRNDSKFKLNTDGDFFFPDRHLKLDNTERSAEVVAREIAEWLGSSLGGEGT